MEDFNFFYSHLILIPVYAFLLSIFLKWFFVWIYTWKINLSRALWSWWMPSAHSAVVVSLATAVALKFWVTSDLFAITMSFTGIISFVASSVRFEAWLHAGTINDLVWEKRVKDSLWQLPSDAFLCSVLSIIITVSYWYV